MTVGRCFTFFNGEKYVGCMIYTSNSVRLMSVSFRQHPSTFGERAALYNEAKLVNIFRPYFLRVKDICASPRHAATFRSLYWTLKQRSDYNILLCLFRFYGTSFIPRLKWPPGLHVPDPSCS